MTDENPRDDRSANGGASDDPLDADGDATETDPAPPIRESLRAATAPIQRFAVGVSTWFALSLPVNGIVLSFEDLIGPAGLAVYPFGPLALGIALTVAVLRYRPGAVDGVWTFGLTSFAVFLVVGFLAVPGFNEGAGLYGSPWVVLDHALAWTAALLVAYVVAYRGGRAAILGRGAE